MSAGSLLRVLTKTMSLITIVTVALCAIGKLANAQDFVTNCTWQTGFLSGSFLGMYCNNDDWARYSYDWTWLDTQGCLINNGGELYPLSRSGGSYWDTCGNCSVRGSDYDFLIGCECLGPGGIFVPTTYDLNRIIWNHDGILGCFDHLGNKTELGPF